jgi:putative ABC transport system permease protein
MAALGFRSFNITGDGEPEKVQAYGATANFFPLLGVTPALGRNFLPEEDQRDGAKVAILSDGLWQRRYGGDRGIVGRDILLNDQKHTVIGVMPADFRFRTGQTALWVPIAFGPEDIVQRDNQSLNVVGRLKAGVSVAQAQADIGAITDRIVRDHPDEVGGLRAEVVPLREELTGSSRQPLLMLLVAVVLVLLIACANTANLLLSRAAGRRREIAVRSAIGANRRRIVRQLLTESIILSTAGGALGLIVAEFSFEFLKRLVPAGLVSSGLRIDFRVLGYALGVSMLTGIIFGLVPALQASRVDLNEALKQGGGRAGLGTSGARWRGAMVITEVALALVLLVGAGLLIQTLSNLRSQFSIFEPAKLLTLRTVLQGNKYREPAQRWAFYEHVLERTKALPGVVSVGYTTSVPLQWKGGANGFNVEGLQDPKVSPHAIHRQVSSEYFQTIGMVLREGRFFDSRDNEHSTPVVVINETMAHQYWADQTALGKRIQFETDGPWISIVGVVADVREMGLDVPVKAEMYLPFRQMTGFQGYKPRDLVIRTSADPLALAAAVTREVHALDPDQPVSSIATLEQVLTSEIANRAVGMKLLVAFAALAVILAVLGIYGVLAFFVTQHTPEIGVRLALGAQTRNILGLVLKKGMGLAGAGIVLGCFLAYALTRLMAALLFGVKPTDVITFVIVSFGLGLVALLACYIPARRATKVDPLVALRYE